MKKRTIMLSFLLCILLVSSVFAATYTTSRTGSSQGYSVTARAHWIYETGRYSSKGPHTVNSRPSNTLIRIHSLEYLLQHIDSDRYGVTQYFRPVYYDPVIDHTTYGSSFGIYLQTHGPMSVDF